MSIGPEKKAAVPGGVAQTKGEGGSDDDALERLVASTDTGGRAPQGASAHILLWIAVAWSLFQLWYASPLPFIFASWIPVLNDTQARSIHLAFGVFLAFLAYPALGRSPRHYIPVQDWILAFAAAFCAAYLFLYNAELARRPGRPTDMDLIAAGAGIVLLLEATRRALGPPLMIVALVFLAYVFFGQYAPDVIAWRGASFQRAMSHMWLTTEGVFGIAVGVSTSFVFLFVLFGSMLDKAGAGNYFIKVAFAMLGRFRGGPAKAAVLASAMTGVISGSSIANVVTTGTFTIPLMKRVGFSGSKAGAVEVASSVNGQIMPPVMGAAAFLMVEYVGIPYVEVIRHAFLPAIISYIALLYIVHLEALRLGMKGLKRPGPERALYLRAIGIAITVSSIFILAGATYFVLTFIQANFPRELSTWTILALVFAVYVGLVFYASRFPDLVLDDPKAPVVSLPELGPTVKTGLHYILPIVVLIWMLMVERRSPGLAAFWASALMIFILLTQRPLMALFRRRGMLPAAFIQGVSDLVQALAAGARNMIGIAVATATAGIIVGTVSLTGIGQVMTQFVEFISGGNLMLMLIFVALLSLVLGMGLPTTANYIVVSSLLAGVVVELGAQSGLVVPLIAIHLFVFYFGIMADVTPPVGLASFAAAAVSGADPIRTGFQAAFYSLRTGVLPFLFIFNNKLLLIGIEGPWDLAVTVFGAVSAILIFSAASMGYFYTRSRLWESAVLLLVAFTLFRPGFWLDRVDPPYEVMTAEQAMQILPDKEPDADLRVTVSGEDFSGNAVTRTVLLPLGPQASAEERLAYAGIELRIDEDGRAFVDMLHFGRPAEQLGVDFDYELTAIEVPAERVSAYWFYIPAFLGLGLVLLLQRRRARAEDAQAREGAGAEEASRPEPAQ